MGGGLGWKRGGDGSVEGGGERIGRGRGKVGKGEGGGGEEARRKVHDNGIPPFNGHHQRENYRNEEFFVQVKPCRCVHTPWQDLTCANQRASGANGHHQRKNWSHLDAGLPMAERMLNDAYMYAASRLLRQ